MNQKGAEIWAKQSDLQPVHGESDSLLANLPSTKAAKIVDVSFSHRIIYLYECINTSLNFTMHFMYIKNLSCFAEKVRDETAKECLFRGQSSHFILDALESSESSVCS